MSKLAHNKKVIVILPAYNAALTLERTVKDIPSEWVDDILLVDDASRDNTVEVAKKIGLKTFVHDANRGYGANQKTCYEKALGLGADIVVMVHPDHQYDPQLIPVVVDALAHGEADAVFGSRMLVPKNALEGGMPYWKYIANIVLTAIENMFLGLDLSEYHSGFRAYTKKTLTVIPFKKNSDNFVFDTEIIVQMVIAGLSIKEVPIPTKYFAEASSIGLFRSMQYGIGILITMLRYSLHRLRIRGFNK